MLHQPTGPVHAARVRTCQGTAGKDALQRACGRALCRPLARSGARRRSCTRAWRGVRGDRARAWTRSTWPVSSSLRKATAPGYTQWRGSRPSQPAGKWPPLDMSVSSMSLTTCAPAAGTALSFYPNCEGERRGATALAGQPRRARPLARGMMHPRCTPPWCVEARGSACGRQARARRRRAGRTAGVGQGAARMAALARLTP